MISRLQKIVEVVPEIKIIYKLDLLNNEHLIKVFPENQYISNQNFGELESDLILDFITEFPMESVIFFSENENFSINNPDKIFLGHNYIDGNAEEIKFNWRNNEFLLLDDEVDFFDIGNVLKDYTNFIDDEVFENLKLESNSFEKYIDIITSDIIFNFDKKANSSVFEYCSENEIDDSIDNCSGENNFALAA